MDVKIGVEGLAELSRGLRQISADAPKELRIALNAGAQILVDAVRPKVPSVTGAARSSGPARCWPAVSAPATSSWPRRTG